MMCVGLVSLVSTRRCASNLFFAVSASILLAGCGSDSDSVGSPPTSVNTSSSAVSMSIYRINTFSGSLSDSSKGNWSYKYIEGGTSGSGSDPWFEEAYNAFSMVKDTSWFGGAKEVFARGDDLNPVISEKSMTFNLQHPDYSPLVKFSPATQSQKQVSVSIVGSFLLVWAGFDTIRGEPLLSDVEISLVKIFTDGTTEFVFSYSAQKPGGSSDLIVDIDSKASLQAGESLALSIRGAGDLAAGASPGAWITLSDEHVVYQVGE